jgi:hypothetical protein
LISLSAQIDLLKRLGSAPLGPLVEALRDLHERGPASVQRLDSLLFSPRSSPASAAPDPSRPPIEPAPEVDYETARRHFADHGRRLREQAILADHLLERFVRPQSMAPPTSLQQQLAVTCARGSTTSTRFVVVNREEREMTVRFDASQCLGIPAPADTDLRACLSFDPPTPRLRAGEETVVRLSLDLTSYEGRGGVIELGVDVRNEQRLLVRLWIRVEVTEREAANG